MSTPLNWIKSTPLNFGLDVVITIEAKIERGSQGKGSVYPEILCAAIPSPSQVGKMWDEGGMTTAKDIHAGAIETTIIHAYWLELVAQPIPKTAHCTPDISTAKVQPILQAIGSYAITQQRIWGAPEDADRNRGVELIEGLNRDVHKQIIGLLAKVNGIEEK